MSHVIASIIPPDLCAADIKISVMSGSDIALEAADLVYLDKFNFIIDTIYFRHLIF